ncbi:hypothetical protein RA19_20805 [Leisingera sp. ANG-M1]|nr:hypothetical protein RA19_20805 [Leisingera sp. ANG-M1]
MQAFQSDANGGGVLERGPNYKHCESCPAQEEFFQRPGKFYLVIQGQAAGALASLSSNLSLPLWEARVAKEIKQVMTDG